MSDEGELALATALTSARFGLRERLEFPFMELSEIEARAIAEVLTEPTNNVVHIDLSDNRIEDEGCIAIAEALKHPCNKVTWLNLVKNKIGDAGASALTEAIRHPNNKIKHLYFGLNKVGVKGTLLLAEALKDSNNKISQLYLGWNPMGDEGAKAVSKALVHPNNKVTELCVMYGGISSSNELADALSHKNCRLKVLKVDGNPIGSQGARRLISQAKSSCLNYLQAKDDLALPEVKLQAMRQFSNGLNSEWFSILVTLLSIYTCTRLAGPGCLLKMLPKDLLRKAADILGWRFEDYSAVLQPEDESQQPAS